MRATATLIQNAETMPVSRAVLRLMACALPFLTAIYSLADAHRNYQIGMDFRLTYAASRAWLEGADPYDDAALKAVWRRGEMPYVTPPGFPQTPNVYPLSIAPYLAPIAMLPFTVALALWFVLNATVVSILTGQIIGRGIATNRDTIAQRDSFYAELLPCVTVFILLLGFPLRYGLTFGNLAVVTTFLVMQTLIYRDRPIIAGICYGLALVKYSLCGPLALLFLIERRWRLLAVATIVQIVLLGAATIFYADGAGLQWISRMFDVGLQSIAPGAVNDYAALNYSALHLELAALLHRLTPAIADWRTPITIALGIVTLMCLFIPHRASKPRCVSEPRPSGSGPRSSVRASTHLPHLTADINAAHTELRYIVMLALTLLVVYHRVYDLILVVAPLVAWMIRHQKRLSAPLRTLLWLALVLSMTAGATVRGGSADASWPVIAFVQPVAIWALLLMLVAGCAALISRPMNPAEN